MECGKIRHTFVPGLFRIDTILDVYRHHLSYAGAFRAHTVGIVEGKIRCRAHIWCADARIQKAQSGIHITDGAHRRTDIASQPSLIHDD